MDQLSPGISTSGLLKAVSGIYGPTVAGNIDIRTAEGCVWNLRTNCRREYRHQDCWRLCLECTDQLSPGISTSGLLKAVSGIYGPTVAKNIDIRTAEGCVWNLRTNCRREYWHQDCWSLCLESTDQLSPGISTSGLLKAVSGIYGPTVAGNIDIRTAEGCVLNLRTNCRLEYRHQDCWRLCLESTDQLSPGISTSGLLKAVSRIYGPTVTGNIDIRTDEGCVWNLRTNCRREYRHQDC